MDKELNNSGKKSELQYLSSCRLAIPHLKKIYTAVIMQDLMSNFNLDIMRKLKFHTF